MSGKLMDTNIIIRVLNSDRELVKRLSETNGLCSYTVVLSELLYDAMKSQRFVPVIDSVAVKKRTANLRSYYPWK